jgi:hypothetical protein
MSCHATWAHGGCGGCRPPRSLRHNMKKAGHTNMRLAASFVHMMPSPSGKQHSIACSTSAVREASRSAPWKLRRKRLSKAKNSHRSSSLRRPAAGNTPRKTESPQQPLVAAVTVRVRMGFSSNSQARCSLARLSVMRRRLRVVVVVMGVRMLMQVGGVMAAMELAVCHRASAAEIASRRAAWCTTRRSEAPGATTAGEAPR